MPYPRGDVRHFFPLVLALSLAMTAAALWRHQPPDWTFAQPRPPRAEAPATFEVVFERVRPGLAKHAPAIRVEAGRVEVIWYEGSKEGARDVGILTAALVPGPEGWRLGPARRLMTSAALGPAMVPRQSAWVLGNAVPAPLAPGAGYLATIVSVGGWAMASVAHVAALEEGALRARRLALSPMLARSHLVRGPVLAFEDGDIGLPAYFEMGTAFSELVRLSPSGRVVDKRRMSHGKAGIQPEIVVLSPREAVAFLRNFDDRRVLYVTRTEDGGQTWSPIAETGLPSPDSPAAAIALAGGRILMAFNDDPRDTGFLRLAVSDDAGTTRRRIATLDDAPKGAMRYPALARLPDGQILLVYSYDGQEGLRGHLLNDAWIDAR